MASLLDVDADRHLVLPPPSPQPPSPRAIVITSPRGTSMYAPPQHHHLYHRLLFAARLVALTHPLRLFVSSSPSYRRNRTLSSHLPLRASSSPPLRRGLTPLPPRPSVSPTSPQPPRQPRRTFACQPVHLLGQSAEQIMTATRSSRATAEKTKTISSPQRRSPSLRPRLSSSRKGAHQRARSRPQQAAATTRRRPLQTASRLQVARHRLHPSRRSERQGILLTNKRRRSQVATRSPRRQLQRGPRLPAPPRRRSRHRRRRPRLPQVMAAVVMRTTRRPRQRSSLVTCTT